MGAYQSAESAGHKSSPEELSYVLAERFATKCFTPLELTHFKDNFYSRAIEQGGVKYWNEKILSDFLGVPDSSDSQCPLDAGPVIFRMVSYLGAFPFQNTLAPSVLTFDAMVKVVVLLTERYGKVLRKARRDRIRLLFGSLADVGRRDEEKSANIDVSQGDDDALGDTASKSHAPGFAIDAPANDGYDDEEDDDLALAALESLDAIEVFKHDSRVERAVYEARISDNTFRRLLMLLIVISDLKTTESAAVYTSNLSVTRMESIRKQTDSIMAAFHQESSGGIRYKSFAESVASSLPYLFDPLTPLFEHFLFSKNLDLSQKRDTPDLTESKSDKPALNELQLHSSPSIMLEGSFESVILSTSIISHLSFFLPSTSEDLNFLRGHTRLHPVFSTAAHGSSLTSFSHNVLTWSSGTLLLLEGVSETNSPMILGAYLPQPWKSPSSTTSSSKFSNSVLPCLFQLSPKHMLLQGNSSPSVQKPDTPTAYFSTSSGISIGCRIPPSSRSNHKPPTPLGAGSLTIDANLETATFYVHPVGHDGSFLPPVSSIGAETTYKTSIDIYNLEIWGLVPDPTTTISEDGKSAVELQQAKWDFEAREAERRRNLNLKAGAGDSAAESARWLLETAGIIGDNSRRGGSHVV
ncbi:TLD domain-containing protein [Aspergillus fijiensis CBS 313.89]|uniref:Restriction of telomere capping protein 5 n=1 Tax=Aspergillus fijiensis CBS 313.89 TaxID=1448319 RepID=A0A8G1RX33_9EURO|nr:restriction of telomere capping protein 5 [Aspergillus fijiensis CBS 313.89]RAK80623.1 restriction of telomere capping protein 5 [Aspergillus fijiensis CBS 313.89]